LKAAPLPRKSPFTEGCNRTSRSSAGSREVRSTARGLGSRLRDLLDGDLNGVNDYGSVLAEILEKRCEASTVWDVFPGIDNTRFGVATQA
jgi:hypothetical protein